MSKNLNNFSIYCQIDNDEGSAKNCQLTCPDYKANAKGAGVGGGGCVAFKGSEHDIEA